MPLKNRINNYLRDLSTKKPRTPSDLAHQFLAYIKHNSEYYAEIEPFWQALQSFVAAEKEEKSKTVTLDEIIQRINVFFTKHPDALKRDSALMDCLSAFFSVHRAPLFKLHRGLQHKLTIVDPWADVAANIIEQLNASESYFSGQEPWLDITGTLNKQAGTDSIDVTTLIQNVLQKLKQSKEDEKDLQLLHWFKASIPEQQIPEVIDLLILKIKSKETWYLNEDVMNEHNDTVFEMLADLIECLPEQNRRPALGKFIPYLESHLYQAAALLTRFEPLLSDEQCTQIITLMMAKHHGRLILPFKRGMTPEHILAVKAELALAHDSIEKNTKDDTGIDPCSRYIYFSRLLPDVDQQDPVMTANVSHYKTKMNDKAVAKLSEHHARWGYDSNHDMKYFRLIWRNFVVTQDVIPENIQYGIINGMLGLLPSPEKKEEDEDEDRPDNNLRTCLGLLQLKRFFPTTNFNSDEYPLNVDNHPFAHNKTQPGKVDIEAKKHDIIKMIVNYISADKRLSQERRRLGIYYNSYGFSEPAEPSKNRYIHAALSALRASEDFIPESLQADVKAILIKTMQAEGTAEHDAAAKSLLTWVDKMTSQERIALLFELAKGLDYNREITTPHAILFIYTYHCHQREVAALQQTPEATWRKLSAAAAQTYTPTDEKTAAVWHQKAAFCQSLFKRHKAKPVFAALKEEKAKALQNLAEREACKGPLLAQLAKIKDALESDDLVVARDLMSELRELPATDSLYKQAGIPVLNEVDRVRFQVKPK